MLIIQLPQEAQVLPLSLATYNWDIIEKILIFFSLSLSPYKIRVP